MLNFPYSQGIQHNCYSVKQCPPFPTVANSTVHGSSRDYGQKVSYRCLSGFEAQTSEAWLGYMQTYQCDSNAQWAHANPDGMNVTDLFIDCVQSPYARGCYKMDQSEVFTAVAYEDLMAEVSKYPQGTTPNFNTSRLNHDLQRICREFCMDKDKAYCGLTKTHCVCLHQKPVSTDEVDPAMCNANDCIDDMSNLTHHEGRPYCGPAYSSSASKFTASVYITSLGCKPPIFPTQVFLDNEWHELDTHTNVSNLFFPYKTTAFMFCPNDTVIPWTQEHSIEVDCGIAARWFYGPFECDRKLMVFLLA